MIGPLDTHARSLTIPTNEVDLALATYNQADYYRQFRNGGAERKKENQFQLSPDAQRVKDFLSLFALSHSETLYTSDKDL